jgi:elongation factor G
VPKEGPERVRNVAILGHSHDGKTTLAEALMFAAGAIPRMGATEQGTSALDFEPEEQRRRISINLAVGHLEFEGVKVNLLDTPGFFDFAGQVVAGLGAADGALLVASAGTDIAVGTELAWDRLSERSTPRLIVVTKLDKENADFLATVDRLRERFNPRPVALHLPLSGPGGFEGVVDLLNGTAHRSKPDGTEEDIPVPDELKALVAERCEQVTEAAAEGDDELLEKYLEEGTLTEEEIERGLREGVAAGKVCPVLACSPTTLVGVRACLRSMTHLLPPPQVRADGDPSVFVFNTTADPFVGRVSYFKVLSGTVRSDQQLANPGRGTTERLGQLFYPQGKEHENAQRVEAGDIGAVTKLVHTFTNDVLGSNGVSAPASAAPLACYALAIFPKSRGDEVKISTGLAHLVEEDSSLHIERNEETKQLLVRGLGDVHVDVVLEKLKRKYGVDATTELPRIPYRETVRGSSRAEGRHVKQSGGHGQYGICQIEVEPVERGEGFIWEDKIFGGSIPHNFRPSVQKGVQEAMSHGIVAGYPMVDIRVRLVDGKYHTVDSSDMAFQIAGSIAIRHATLDADPVLLEPVDEVEVRVPERYLGDIMSDLNAKRGRISGTEMDGEHQVIKAHVPQSEMQRFALDLRSMTQGRGSFTAGFSHYEEVPAHLAKPLIDSFQKEHAARD